jgi:hypothetical protein
VPTLFAVLVLGLLIGGAAWLWLRSGDAPDPDRVAGEPPPAGAVPAPTETEPEPEPPPLDLPPLSASDALVRDMVGRLSAHPRLAAWLVTDDLVYRFVGAVVVIAGGRSPVSHVEFMAPDGELRVQESGGRLVIHPASFGRYDLLTQTFVSVDTRGSARLYRHLHPLFEEAHQELGFPEGTFHETFALAVENILAVEVPRGPLEVTEDEGVYVFRDRGLEALSPAAKHLLRMGPENARHVQSKLGELAGAIGVSPGA